MEPKAKPQSSPLPQRPQRPQQPSPLPSPSPLGRVEPERPEPRRADAHRVVVLALAGLLPFELGIPHRIFGRAKDPAGRPLYEILTCGLAPGPVRTDADFAVHVEHGPELLATADTVVVPASYELGPVYDHGRLTGELAAALAHIRPGTRLVSICTGGYVLAAAGYLDGRPATTHWASAEHFQRLFPAVRVDPGVLYTDDGDVLTSAGVAAGIDLCVHIVRRDHGAAVANEVARRTVVPPHREGGQAQFIERPVPEPQLASTTAARAWVLDRLHEPLRLTDLARQEAMSVRTFTRRFREESGISPGQWITGQRVERARRLLELTDLPVEQVARETGFGTAQSLRKHVQAVLGVSPTAYRRTFREGGAGGTDGTGSAGVAGGAGGAGARAS
ncbi:GlxA family transcriptional regulator [Streptomyces sp. NPDC058611]|uniref:GlxA family transcriptional regulator n=1 Tax=unclassified Streptomyces TaxID=2593676 RepID=UPI0036680813